MAYGRDGAVRVVAEPFMYCNGIALDRDGTLVVIEGRGLQRLLPDGGREWIAETLGRGGGDGFCLDTEGNYYVAATVDHGVRVVDPAGAEVDFLPIDGDGVTTNCCFGGTDGRTLFATDAVPGRVVAWEGLPHPGLPLHPGPGPAGSATASCARRRRGRAPRRGGRREASRAREGRSTRRSGVPGSRARAGVRRRRRSRRRPSDRRCGAAPRPGGPGATGRGRRTAGARAGRLPSRRRARCPPAAGARARRRPWPDTPRSIRPPPPPTARAARPVRPGTTRPCVPTRPARAAVRESRTIPVAVSGTTSGIRLVTAATRGRRRRARRCARSRLPPPARRARRPVAARRRCRRRRAGSPRAATSARRTPCRAA